MKMYFSMRKRHIFRNPEGPLSPLPCFFQVVRTMPMPFDALLIIDMQQGFLHQQEALIHKVGKLAGKVPPEHTYWLKYRNHPDSMFTRHLNWGDMMVSPRTDLPAELAPLATQIFEHYVYGLPQELLARLKTYAKVGIAGVDTDACVFAATFNLWDEGVQPVILAEYCHSSGGHSFHQAALNIMQRQFGADNLFAGML